MKNIAKEETENFLRLGTTVKNYKTEDEREPIYVDLGLPSGKKWAFRSVPGFWSFDKAKETFGNALPSVEEWKELFENTDKRLCEQTMELFLMSGKTQRYIVLPIAGALQTNGEKWDMETIERFGNYWSGDGCPDTDENMQRYAYFREGKLFFGTVNLNCGLNVQLISR